MGFRSRWLRNWDQENIDYLRALAVRAYLQSYRVQFSDAPYSVAYASVDSPVQSWGVIRMITAKDVPSDLPDVVLSRLEQSPVKLGGVSVSLDDDALTFVLIRSFSGMDKNELIVLSDEDINVMVKGDIAKMDNVFSDCIGQLRSLSWQSAR